MQDNLKKIKQVSHMLEVGSLCSLVFHSKTMSWLLIFCLSLKCPLASRRVMGGFLRAIPWVWEEYPAPQTLMYVAVIS